jgi:hypothetical protein
MFLKCVLAGFSCSGVVEVIKFNKILTHILGAPCISYVSVNIGHL